MTIFDEIQRRANKEVERLAREAFRGAVQFRRDLSQRKEQLRRTTQNAFDKVSSEATRAAPAVKDVAIRMAVHGGNPVLAELSRPKSILRETGLQVDTASRTAANVLTNGGADKFSAFMDATVGRGSGEGKWGQRYNANLAKEQARNDYDSKHRRGAQAVGTVAGIAMGLRGGGAIYARTALPRLAGAAGLTGRETIALLGAGAATNVALQAATDAVEHRHTTLPDAAASALGGMAGTGATLMRSPKGAQLDGFVTSIAGDAFNRRSIDFEKATKAGAASGTTGQAVGRIGAKVVNNLSISAKGQLGEAVGGVRSLINRMEREGGPKKRFYIPGFSKYIYPDGRSGDTIFEDKFGYSAALSKGQELAKQVLGDKFVIYHLLPDDVGAAARLSAAGSSPATSGQDAAPSASKREGPSWRSAP